MQQQFLLQSSRTVPKTFGFRKPSDSARALVIADRCSRLQTAANSGDEALCPSHELFAGSVRLLPNLANTTAGLIIKTQGPRPHRRRGSCALTNSNDPSEDVLCAAGGGAQVAEFADDPPVIPESSPRGPPLLPPPPPPRWTAVPSPVPAARPQARLRASGGRKSPDQRRPCPG